MINEATFNNDNPKNRYQCHHIFPDDHRCGSPRMNNEQFCYFHHDFRRPVVRPQERLARQSTFSLFTPDTPDSIQDALGELLIRVAANHIDPRRARLILNCLQLASTNLRTARKAAQLQTTSSQAAEDTNPAPGADQRPATPLLPKS